MAHQNVIYGINGPVVTVKNAKDFSMMEMVYVGKEKLVGEIIGITDTTTTVQVYEETSGAFISRGASVPSLDPDKKWNVTMKVKTGDKLSGGMIYATLPETPIIEHRLLVPPLIGECVVTSVKPDGEYTLNDTIVTVKEENGRETELTLCQKWPIRTPRPVKQRLSASIPLITGQRVIDTLFPIAKGGTAAIPGGFGTGKTMTQHQLAKWCDADIIIYVGCGERGNEMSQVLQEFSELIDPKSNRPMTDRTVLIANTSNMPVAAR